jgi:hypothetical protein
MAVLFHGSFGGTISELVYRELPLSEELPPRRRHRHFDGKQPDDSVLLADG